MFISSCSSSYKMLQPAPETAGDCLSKFKPNFTRALYTAQVDVTDHHLSGLLLVKLMPDSSTRLVFTMEAGFKFFDFEFSKDGNFTVHSITDKMNKKAVIKTLRKDFETILMQRIEELPLEDFTTDSLVYHRIKREDSYDYYITDKECNKLERVEKTGGRKTIVVMKMEDYKDGVPGTITVDHQTFKFNISLKKLEQ